MAPVTTAEDLKHRFEHHPPGADKIIRHGTIRRTLQAAAVEVADLTQPSREQSLAFTHLEEAMFWANAAIAREPVDRGGA